jgi:hypothetical protein
VLLHEGAEDRDRVRLGDRVGIDDQHQLVLRQLRAEIRVRREGERPLVHVHARARRQLRGDAAGDVCDHEQLVDLRRKRRQRRLQLCRVPVRDDDGADLHTSA